QLPPPPVPELMHHRLLPAPRPAAQAKPAAPPCPQLPDQPFELGGLLSAADNHERTPARRSSRRCATSSLESRVSPGSQRPMGRRNSLLIHYLLITTHTTLYGAGLILKPAREAEGALGPVAEDHSEAGGRPSRPPGAQEESNVSFVARRRETGDGHRRGRAWARRGGGP